MSEVIRIAGIAGSLRKGSYNKSALQAALTLVPKGSSLDILDLEGIPGFNQDLEQAFPPPAREFKAKVKAADAILVVTPEYNYSVPGVLKNASIGHPAPMATAPGMASRLPLWALLREC